MTEILLGLPDATPAQAVRQAARWVMSDLLGLEARWTTAPPDRWTLSVGGRELVLPNLLFPGKADPNWPTAASLPPDRPPRVSPGELGIGAEFLCGGDLPVLFGRTRVESAADLDIFGSVFFLLSRLEEVVRPVEDMHGRFPASASVAVSGDFLHRPLADEYAELLRQLLEAAAPGCAGSRPPYRLALSHDVDVPSRWVGAGPLQLARSTVGDLLRQGPAAAAEALASYRDWRRDPRNTFSWMMDVAEGAGLRAVFHFIAGGDDPHDLRYDLRRPEMAALLGEIDARGHEIGLHGSYLTLDDGDRLARERRALEAVSPQPVRGGRQHYLRARVPQSWCAYCAAGLAWDASLGFADRAGFRAGTAREYGAYDLVENRPLPLRIRPLHVMEHSLLDPAYEGLARPDAGRLAATLAGHVRRLGGEFSLLWHNHNLVQPEDRALYSALVAELN